MFGTSFGNSASSGGGLPFMTATGGDVPAGIIVGDYKVHTFSSSSNFTVTSLGSDPTYGSSVEYLIVAGGGGGGYETGGGGGAGGLLTATSATVSATSYTATVGAGGAGAQSNATGSNGGDSSIFSITAVGGGVGGQSLNPYYGNGKLSLTVNALLDSITSNTTDATPGTYTNVTLSGGSGTGGVATVGVSGGGGTPGRSCCRCSTRRLPLPGRDRRGTGRCECSAVRSVS